MKFGLTQAQYDYLKDALRPIVETGAVIWCFGSRARGDHKQFSDIDLLIESNQDLRKILGEVSEKLIEGPFQFKVDLVLDSDLAQAYRVGVEKDKKKFC